MSTTMPQSYPAAAALASRPLRAAAKSRMAGLKLATMPSANVWAWAAAAVKASLGLARGLYPVPMLTMIMMAVLGTIYLTRTVMGRHIFAFGGNAEASRFAGLSLSRIQIGVFAVSGLTAGLAAFLGAGFYGSASSGDAQGYELYVIASAVVGGASLLGGKGSALGATLGAVLIVLIRQSIRTLHFDQNYEWIVIGCAIIVAVVVDQWSTRAGARRMSVARGTLRPAA